MENPSVVDSPDAAQTARKPVGAEEAAAVPLREIVEHRQLLNEHAGGHPQRQRFTAALERRFKTYGRVQAMPARVTTTLLTAALFLSAPLWTAGLLGIPESTRVLTLWISLLGLGPAFLAVTFALRRWPLHVWTENAFMAAFLMEAIAIEALIHQADLAAYRVTPVISAAVPVAVLTLGRLPVMRSLLFVGLYVAMLVIKQFWVGTTLTSTEMLTIAILISLTAVSTVFSQRTRRQSWALLQLMRAGAQIDFLTGLPNRSGSEIHTDKWTRASRRDARPYGVAIIDLDHFKRINDRYGHAHGDGVLKEVALTIDRFARRPGDLAARIGGEEFILFLYNCEQQDALRIYEELRVAVHDLDIENIDSPFGRVTVSIGVTWVAFSEQISTTYEKADTALYAAKRSGRNKVICHQDK